MFNSRFSVQKWRMVVRDKTKGYSVCLGGKTSCIASAVTTARTTSDKWAAILLICYLPVPYHTPSLQSLQLTFLCSSLKISRYFRSSSTAALYTVSYIREKALAVTYLMGYILPTINTAAARVKYGTLYALLGWIKIAYISQLRERRTVSHI
jgi:hypothetical protein